MFFSKDFLSYHSLQIKMHPAMKQRRVKHKKGDVIIDNLTKIRKCYDGNKWRRLCSVQQCNKKAQLHGVCMRHSRKYEIELNDNQHTQSIKPELVNNSFPLQNGFHNPGKSIRYSLGKSLDLFD